MREKRGNEWKMEGDRRELSTESAKGKRKDKQRRIKRERERSREMRVIKLKKGERLSTN